MLNPKSTQIVFSDKEIPAEYVQTLLQAALGTMHKGTGNTCELYVTDNRQLMDRLADARESGAEAIKSAPLAVAVVADRLYDGSWVENCQNAVWAMRIAASELKLASVAIQIRGYSLTDGTLSDDVVRGVLDIPDGKTVCVLFAVGYAEINDKAGDEDLEWERIHIV